MTKIKREEKKRTTKKITNTINLRELFGFDEDRWVEFGEDIREGKGVFTATIFLKKEMPKELGCELNDWNLEGDLYSEEWYSNE